MLSDFLTKGWPRNASITNRYRELLHWKKTNGDTVCLGGTEEEYQILNAVASLFPNGTILEIGPGDGCSSEAMLLGTTCEILQVNIDSRGLMVVSEPKRVRQWVGKSDQFFTQNKQMFDVVYVDGEHQSPYVDGDIQSAIRVCNLRGVVLLHDIDQYDIEVAAKRIALAAKRTYIGIDTGEHGIGIIF